MSDRKGTVGDLKRALANIPDDVYVIIPQDSDDGGRGYLAYWNGDPHFYHPERVANNAARFGYMDVENPYMPWDTVVYLSEGDEFTPADLGTPDYIVYMGIPCRAALSGGWGLYWHPVGGRYDENEAVKLFDQVVADEPYPQRPVRLANRHSHRPEDIIRRNDGQEDL